MEPLLIVFAVAFIIAGFFYIESNKKTALKLFYLTAVMVLTEVLLAGGFTVEQIFCWLIGFSFFILSVYLFTDKDKFSIGFVVFLISVLAFFCGLSSVQSFLKTGMLMRVVTTLDDYGKKIDAYQTNVIEMRNQLSDQQDLLKSNQLSLASNIVNVKKDFSDRQNSLGQQINGFENLIGEQGSTIVKISANLQNAENTILGQQATNAAQFLSISILQSNLLVAQSNLDAQSKQLANVEYWVQNLYSNVTTETYSVTDTNNLIFTPRFPDNKVMCIIRLNYAPIPNSIEETVVNEKGQQLRYYPDFKDNIFVNCLTDFDTNNMALSFHYIIDYRKTNFWHHMPQVDKDISFSLYPKYSILSAPY